MKPHLTAAHQRWQAWIHPGDIIVDATLGNGHDTLFLAELLQGQGQLIGYDIQPQALEQTQKRLRSLPGNFREAVTLKLESHAQFATSNVKLFVYNLGYLPGGDKQITTRTEVTLLSLQSAIDRLGKQGAISITCYPGHPEGAVEQAAVLAFLQTLPSSQWDICHHVWLNRPHSPTWIWMQAVPGA